MSIRYLGRTLEDPAISLVVRHEAGVGDDVVIREVKGALFVVSAELTLLPQGLVAADVNANMVISQRMLVLRNSH